MVQHATATDFRLAKQAHEIHSRADLERWKSRSTRRIRFIILSYLIGSLASVALAFMFGLVEAIKAGDLTVVGIIADFKIALVGGFCCGGPLVLIPCTVLVTGGVSKYKQLLDTLNKESRVCQACEAVALYDDRYVVGSKHKKHTQADLIPHMNIIKEDGKVSVLCDQCLAEVNAMASA